MVVTNFTLLYLKKCYYSTTDCAAVFSPPLKLYIKTWPIKLGPLPVHITLVYAFKTNAQGHRGTYVHFFKIIFFFVTLNTNTLIWWNLCLLISKIIILFFCYNFPNLKSWGRWGTYIHKKWIILIFLNSLVVNLAGERVAACPAPVNTTLGIPTYSK